MELGKCSSVLVVSRTLTAGFDRRVYFYDVSLTGSLKTVWISQDLFYPGLDQRGKLMISLQKQRVHVTALLELDDLRSLGY